MSLKNQTVTTVNLAQVLEEHSWLTLHRSESPNSWHCVMTMLVALLFAFAARTFAVDTNMNVTGKPGDMSIGRNYSAASNTPMSQGKASLRGTETRESRSKSAVGGSVPVVGRVATILLNEYSVSKIEGWAQCVGVVKGYLDYYEHCLPTCAKTVARKIANFACKSYCSCT